MSNQSITNQDYESNYDSGGGIQLSNNDMSYGYHNQTNSNSFGSSTTSTNSLKSSTSSTVKTSFFQSSNQSKYEDLKQMLENSKELLKLEAMKRIITMIAKGRSAESARELFPHVVKNVVTKNTELKKLVYLYLTRYAEQEQDLALLSIATFQHALKDPNPLIRGSAIRVLSSIRVPMISPIVLIAIKDCANDMSPYVRKIAAHAIPKLVSLDCDIKDEVIDIIAKLLADKVSLVLGSAVAAFEQVCPDRFDLIHQNYRKLCQLLVDVDEWGQIIIINMLVRYARTQFINPNRSSSSSSAGVDPDHMLLIRSVKPLLQSRNSGVVLAVIQLYLSVAPHFEITASLVRPLIRLLHSHYEIQLIILKNIVTLTSAEFNQKWLEDNEILTNLSNTGNYISLVLREFQAYILNYQDDLEFMSATIESIGQCASRIKEIAPVCLNGLVSLLSNRNETIVAQSIVVIRTQIINKDQSIISMIVKQIVRLMGKISQPQARATIVWIVAEFCHRNRHARRLAPNVLLQIAKTFCHEHDLVKLQALNLAAKLSITMINDDDDGDGNFGDNIDADDDKLEKLDIDRERLRSLITYVFNLAKYDLNYDVRDRGRFLKHLIGNPQLARRILLMPKQQPNVSQRNHLLVQQQQQQINADVIMADQLPLSSSAATIHQQSSSSLILASSNDSIRYRFGTLSHFLGKRMQDYEELPDYPINAPDSSYESQDPYRILESPESVTYKEFELLDATATDGFKISYRFPRINESTKTLVELIVKCTLKFDDNRNQSRIIVQPPSNGSIQFKNIEYNADDNQAMIPLLAPDEKRLITLAVDFNESPSLGIELKFNRKHSVKLIAPLGDILYPVRFRNVDDFQQERSKLTGMNEVTNTIRIESSQKSYKSLKQLCLTINQIILNLANVCTNQHFNNNSDETTKSNDNQTLYYSACTVKFRSLILITIQIENNNSDDDDSDGDQWTATGKPFTLKTMVNCEKMVLGSMMSKLIKDECQKQL
ncbi:AP-3 complex subunit beta-2 [Dermatophagoides pteronyssinus]|uniref:AP-3 complex subunit beta n=1 Tax=Dermatophagoides pteronyssinus TaxID=6956 RepID=A0ABQ8IT00_DERPT|nr:AP-3 complex subunit beta-2 [Dermatophagoides pteronyssinus]